MTTPGTRFVDAYQTAIHTTPTHEETAFKDLALMLDLDEGIAGLSKPDANKVLLLAMVSIRGGDLGQGTLGQGPKGYATTSR